MPFPKAVGGGRNSKEMAGVGKISMKCVLGSWSLTDTPVRRA